MSSLFKFQQFNIRHDRSAMKIGTDSVLLAAWTRMEGVTQVLDIGTGTGVIALMIAQRLAGNCTIDAVESDKDACMDAAENFSSSPWGNSLTLYHQRIQEFRSEKKYDLIISNPPYFQNSLKPPLSNRQEARHSDSLRLEELAEIALRFLTEKGRIAVILPPPEGEKFIQHMTTKGLHCNRRFDFKSRSDKNVERLLLEFSINSIKMVHGELILHAAGNSWSDEYYELTREFYLKRHT